MLLVSLFLLCMAGVPNNTPLTALSGEKIQNEQLSQKVILFVNVASRCGYTKQYTALQSLYEQYKDKGLEIIGVPCNQFGGQEPGSAEEIQTFCKKNYGVSFPLLEKQDVNGTNRSPLYQQLIKDGADIRWNFEKILVNTAGVVVQRFPSSTDPLSAELTQAIDNLLKK